MLELLATHHYDVCILSLMVDDSDGIELARLIKQDALADYVVMRVYPFELTEAEKQDETHAIDRYLIKPLFRSDYVSLLNGLYGEDDTEKQHGLDLETIDFTGIRVLLAEDLDINREIVYALFEPLGFNIDWARDGREAVEMFSAKPDGYDLILMDMQMPEMDGLEATRRIRSMGSLHAAQVPIIALTANVFKEDIENSLAAGMDDHLGKPIDFNEAIQKIARYLYPQGQ
jgi:CheY-like chemotaxis protein